MSASSVSTPRRTQPERSLADRYEALSRVSQAIGAYRDPKELFCALTKELRKVVQRNGIGVAQYHQTEDRFHWHISERCSQVGALPSEGYALEATITRWVYERQEPLVIPFVD
jgi:hypothetical protein